MESFSFSKKIFFARVRVGIGVGNLMEIDLKKPGPLIGGAGILLIRKLACLDSVFVELREQGFYALWSCGTRNRSRLEPRD